MHPWKRFHRTSGEHLEVLQRGIRALARGEWNDEWRRSSLAQLERLQQKVRGLALTQAAQFAWQLAEQLDHPQPDPGRSAQRWLWLKHEIERSRADQSSELGAWRQRLWVICDDEDYLDHLILAGWHRGVEIRPLDLEQDVPGPDEPVLLRTEDGRCREHLARLRQLQPQALVVAQVSQLDFPQRLALTGGGADTVVPQALPAEQVLDVLARSQARRQASGSRILLIEDEKVARRVVERILQTAGYQVTTLESAEGFWETLETVRPHLVILDYMLPDVLGADLCRAVRSDTHWSSLLVIFLTASRDRETVAEIFTAGADDFLSKPVVPDELLGRIRNRLARSRVLRFQGDLDLQTMVMGRQRAEEQLHLLLRLGLRHHLPVCLGMMRLLEPSPARIAGLINLCREHLRRGGDVLARFSDDTVLIGLFATPRGAGREVLEEILGHPEVASVQASVAAAPADGADLLGLLVALEQQAAQAQPGQVLEVGETQQTLQLAALIQAEELAPELRKELQRLGLRLEWLPNWRSVQDRLNQPHWQPRVLIVDAATPFFDVHLFLSHFRQSHLAGRCQALVLSDGPSELSLRWLEEGAADVLIKPQTSRSLSKRVRQALRSPV